MSKIDINPNDSAIVLDVEIHGKKGITTKRMAPDTGATYIVIPWDVAELLGYKPELSKEKMAMITASGVETAPIVTLKKVSVLGRSYPKVKAMVHDLPASSYVDGLLGLSFLKHFDVHLSFRKKYLEIK